MVPLALSYDPSGGVGGIGVSSQKKSRGVLRVIRALEPRLNAFLRQTTVPCKGVPILEVGVITPAFFGSKVGPPGGENPFTTWN